MKIETTVNSTEKEVGHNNKAYVKRNNQRKLRNSAEYKASRFAFGTSCAIALVAAFLSIDFETYALNPITMAVAGIYLAEGVFEFIVSFLIHRQLIADKPIGRLVRLSGVLSVCMLITGNFFVAISGFTRIKDKKTLEYTLCTYAIITDVCIMLVSWLNVFKPAVAKTYSMGMWLLAGGALLYVIALALISVWATEKAVDKKLIPVAVVLMLMIVTGNVFAFMTGLVLLSRVRQKDEEISIEWVDILKRLFRSNMAAIGLFVVVFLISLSTCSNLTFDYSVAVDNDYLNLFCEPCLAYPFGTDNYGRCVFSRIVYGARISLIVGLISTLVPMVVGGMLGAVAGYFGKTTDNVIMRCLDVLYAVPSMLLAIAIVAAFGASTVNLILALSVSSIPIYARTIRATVMGLASSEFVEAARACGARDGIIIFKHIIPNSLAPVIVRATMGIGTAVLSTTSLSYLGLGVEPHIPEWGNVLKVGSSYLETAPYLAIFPGLAIIVIVLSFNFFGDGLRDATDPRLK